MPRREQPPEFFIDRSLGRRHLADAVRSCGLVVHTMASVYGERAGQRVPDERWLRDVGAKGWIVLMKDDAIRRRPAERDALVEAGGWTRPGGDAYVVGLATWDDARGPLSAAMNAAMAPFIGPLTALDLRSPDAMNREDPGQRDRLTMMFLEALQVETSEPKPLRLVVAAARTNGHGASCDGNFGEPGGRKTIPRNRLRDAHAEHKTPMTAKPCLIGYPPLGCQWEVSSDQGGKGRTYGP